MFCDNCLLKSYNLQQQFPQGVTNPDYYILSDMVNNTENGMQGTEYLNNILMSLGILGNSRQFNLIRCDISSAKDFVNSIRLSCSEYAKIDISKTKPKVVIALGSEVSRLLLENKFSKISTARGKLYEVEIGGVKLKVLPTYSPTYVVQNTSSAETFVEDLALAVKYVNGELVDISDKELVYATNFDEFLDYYNTRCLNAEELAYDLETNAKDPRSSQAQMVGFSLAPDSSTGIYVVRNSLEYQMQENDWIKIRDFMKNTVMKNHKLLVHNCMYEIPFTLNEWDIYIDNFDDTLIKTRLILGGKTGASLKERCMKDLGYPDWDTDLGVYLSSMSNLIKGMKPTSAGKLRDDYIRLADVSTDLRELMRYYNRLEDEDINKRIQVNKESVSNILEVVGKYYEGTEYDNIIDHISREVIARVTSGHTGILSYGTVPMKIITQYGAMDSVGTKDLNQYMDKKIEEYSAQLGINLKQGYEYMKQHYMSGTWMELSGLYWNDDVAKAEKKWYNDKCVSSIRSMVASGYLDNLIIENNRGMLNDYLRDHIEEVEEALGKSCLLMKSGVRPVGEKVIRWGSLVDSLGNDYFQANKNRILELAKAELVKDVDDYKTLKWIFNPGSSSQSNKDLLNSIWVTEEIKIAKLFDSISVMIDDPSFDINNYPQSDRGLFQVILDSRKYNSYVSEYNSVLDDDSNDKSVLEDLELPELVSSEFDSEIESVEVGKVTTSKLSKVSDRELFEKFCITLSKTQVMDSRLQKLIGDALNYRLEKIDEPSVVQLNSYYLITGIVLDDQSTWTKPYKFLIDYRIWKKCNKMVSSYIDGNKLGHGSVWYVDKDKFESGELLTRRKKLWDGVDRPNQTTVMQSNFAVCTASSFRWRAGMHTIPTGAAIKNIYTSRFKGGVIAAPDFCLVADTKIRMADGSRKRIRDLVGKSEFDIFAYDELSNSIVKAKGKDCRLVRYTDKLIRITFDNDKFEECTPEHKFYDMRARKMKEAQEFKVGDSILPIRFKHYPDGKFSVLNPDLAEGLVEDSKKSKPTGRLDGMNQVERLDAILDYLYKAEIAPSMYTWDNLVDRVYPGVKAKAKLKDINELYTNFARFILLRAKPKYSKSWIDQITRKLYYEAHMTKRMSTAIKKSYEYMSMYGLKLDTFFDWENNSNKLRGTLYPCDRVSVEKLQKIFKSVDDIHDYCLNNHKVVKIEVIRKRSPVPVYCFTVPTYHNFFLASGVLSSNSQMELRTMAGAAHCESMIEAFRSGADIHLQNAAKIFRKPPEEVKPEERRYSKMASFMILYGGDYHTFGNQFLGGDIALAKSIYDSFYSAYPEVADYIKAKHDEAKKHEKVTTLMDMFVTMEANDPQFHGDENARMRLAQNAPIQSFEKETQLRGLDGQIYTIGELADKKQDLEVLSYDTYNSKIIPTKGIQAQCTGSTDTWYKITLDNDKYVKVTPEHLMMLRNGTYERADKLYVGQSLMPGYVEINPRPICKGYLKEMYSGELLHRLVYSHYYPNDVLDHCNIHHINLNYLDNTKYNLVALGSSEHIKYHRNLYEYCYSLDENKLAEIENWLTPLILQRYDDSDALEICKSIRDFHRSIPNRPDRLELAERSMTSRNQNRSGSWRNNQLKSVSLEVSKRVESTGNVLGLSKEEYSNVMKNNWVNNRAQYLEALKLAHSSDIAKKNHSNASVVREASPDYVFNRVKKQLLDRYEKGIDWTNPDVWDATAVDYPGPTRRYSWYITKHMPWNEFVTKGKEITQYHNHKIKSIEVIHLDTPEPKYDLHVPIHNNFLLECGVFTHNSASSMLAGCCLYEMMKYIQQNNLKSKVILFVHDSIEVDIHPDEVLALGSQIIPIMNKFPNERFNLPVKADLVLGKSIGQEVEIKSLECNDDYTEGWLDCESTEDHFDALIDTWKEVYPLVEWEDIDQPKEKYKSWSDLWIPKLAIQKGYGENYRIVHRKVHIKIK